MSSVLEAWDRIHRWLEGHAPKILANLNPAASAHEVAVAEAAIGMAMPVEWREFYCVHNGMNRETNLGSLFHGMDVLSLERVVAEYSQDVASRKELGSAYAPATIRAADPGIQTSDMHHAGWVTLAHDNGDALIRVDLAPGDGGHRGQVIFTDMAYGIGILLASNVGEFLQGFANDLESGRYFLNPDALADENEFLACVEEIDLTNWWKSPRWKHLER